MEKYIYEKLNIFKITQKLFDEIMDIENNCGLTPYSPSYVYRLLYNEYVDTFCCYNDKKDLIGYIMIDMDYLCVNGVNTVYINNLIVKEGYQGKGIGTSLIYKAIDFYKRKGIDQDILVTLNVQDYNDRGMKLYKKLGFEVIKEETTDESINYYMAVEFRDLYDRLKEIVKNKNYKKR